MTVFPLIVSWFLTFGYVPEMTESVNGRSVRLDGSYIATVAQIGVAAETAGGRFGVYTDIENFQYAPRPGSGKNFVPFRVNYTAGAWFDINKHVRITVEHECDHPVAGGKSKEFLYHYGSEKTTLFMTVRGSTAGVE